MKSHCYFKTIRAAQAILCAGLLFHIGAMPTEAATAQDYLRLAQRGDVTSMTKIGKMLCEGTNGAPKDLSAGMKWLRKASGCGDHTATLYLGDLYCTGSYGANKNHKKACEYYVKAYQGGIVKARKHANKLEKSQWTRFKEEVGIQELESDLKEDAEPTPTATQNNISMPADAWKALKEHQKKYVLDEAMPAAAATDAVEWREKAQAERFASIYSRTIDGINTVRANCRKYLSKVYGSEMLVPMYSVDMLLQVILEASDDEYFNAGSAMNDNINVAILRIKNVCLYSSAVIAVGLWAHEHNDSNIATQLKPMLDSYRQSILDEGQANSIAQFASMAAIDHGSSAIAIANKRNYGRSYLRSAVLYGWLNNLNYRIENHTSTDMILLELGYNPKDNSNAAVGRKDIAKILTTTFYLTGSSVRHAKRLAELSEKKLSDDDLKKELKYCSVDPEIMPAAMYAIRQMEKSIILRNTVVSLPASERFLGVVGQMAPKMW